MHLVGFVIRMHGNLNVKFVCLSFNVWLSCSWYLYYIKRVRIRAERLLWSIGLSICALAKLENQSTTFIKCDKGKSSYVYWTVHHLDSWIKRDQLDDTCFIISLFNAQHVSDPSSGACNLFVEFSLHTDTTPPQPNHNVTPTYIEREQYNPWNNSTNKSQGPEDGCINVRNLLSIK